MIKYPEMRAELLTSLKGLSDIEYQKKCWLEGDCPNGIEHDEFDYVIHFLFDDTNLSDDPVSTIGYILKDETEARHISKLCTSLKTIFKTHGTEMSDAEYLSVPEWGEVIKYAEEARKACS